MSCATPLTLGHTLAQISWESSRKIAFPFSLSTHACDAGGWRLGPVCEIADTAARIRVRKLSEDTQASLSVDRADITAALQRILTAHHPEHVAVMRGKLSRSQFSLPLATAIARFAPEGGVQPTSEAAKNALAKELAAIERGGDEPPSNGAIWKTARGLVEDGILWLGADGKAVLRDALLGVRLLRPQLHAEIERSLRDEKTAKAARVATRSI
jgi:hypothetical protein